MRYADGYQFRKEVSTMATYPFRKVTVKWQELSELLSKAEVLMADEGIDQITLTNPRQLLLHTNRPDKKDKEEE